MGIKLCKEFSASYNYSENIEIKEKYCPEKRFPRFTVPLLKSNDSFAACKFREKKAISVIFRNP